MQDDLSFISTLLLTKRSLLYLSKWLALYVLLYRFLILSSWVAKNFKYSVYSNLYFGTKYLLNVCPRLLIKTRFRHANPILTHKHKFVINFSQKESKYILLPLLFLPLFHTMWNESNDIKPCTYYHKKYRFAFRANKEISRVINQK